MRAVNYLIAIVFVCLAATTVFAQEASATRALSPRPVSENPLMPIGTAAPDFSLKGTDDQVHTMAEFGHAKVLVIVFEAVHCPVSENYEGRIRQLYDSYHGKGVAFVAINPNNPSAVRLDELGYTDLTDSLDDMKIRVRDRKIPWPFLYDGTAQETAHKFGAVATPHVFIFDADRKLRYEGRIDDNQNEALVKSHDAHDAIESLLADKPVAVSHTPAFGCSTKWLSKSADVQREWARIMAEPVTVSQASRGEVNSLRANAGSNVTVVHFWSLKSSRLDEDFVRLEMTYRMYRQRSFSLVTINTDPATDADKIAEFLKSQHASSTNLQIAPEDLKAFQTAFGFRCDSNVGFTAVIAPGGKVVYTHRGAVEVLAVRHAALTHFTDNPYFPGQAQYWAELAAH